MKQAFWIIIALLLVSIGVNVWQWKNQPEASVVIERDTVWKDSIIREPVAAETIQTGRVVYIKIPVPSDTQGTGTAVPSKDSTGVSQSPCVADSIEVSIPIVQKRYEDSLYTAWVSGFEPNLDSIDLRLPTVTETITKTIAKPSPRLSVGLQTGAGVGVFQRKADVYLGVGVQYRLWPK